MPRRVNLSPTGTYALARNISKVNTTGVETELQYVKKMDNRQQIWATLGMIWLESKSSISYGFSSACTYLEFSSPVGKIQLWDKLPSRSFIPFCSKRRTEKKSCTQLLIENGKCSCLVHTMVAPVVRGNSFTDELQSTYNSCFRLYSPFISK